MKIVPAGASQALPAVGAAMAIRRVPQTAACGGTWLTWGPATGDSHAATIEMAMTIEEIVAQIRDFRDERDWMQFHNPKDMAIAISLEASELLEHFLWKPASECEAVARARGQQIEEEVADIAIFLFEFADDLGIDLLTAMDRKIQLNREKYPVSKSKGSSTKYTDL